MTDFTQTALRISLTTPFGADKLIVTYLTGHEEVSGLFSYQVEAVSTDAALSAATVLGKAVSVTLHLPDGKTRIIHARVAGFMQGGADQRTTRYRLDLVPWCWLLTLTQDCRIFQNSTVPDIISTVCSELGFTDLKKSLTQTYTARDYCVQYRETAWDFLCRLMSEEGIFFYFTHTDSAHTLVLADSTDGWGSDAGSLTWGVAGEQTVTRADVLYGGTLRHGVTTNAVQYDDYSFLTPSTDLKSSRSGDSPKWQIYDWPGLYTKKSDGDTLTQQQQQAHTVAAVTLTADSGAGGLIAGGKMSVTGHPASDVNAGWVIRRLETVASQREYHNTLAAFPAATAFRPLRMPRPRISGSQTALVVGKSGEEIWTDQYGRIKVQFHWDQRGQKDENASCWIRVAQGWAGKGWGMWVLPRIGQEVVVSFEEGDPDRPLVTGCVYNAEQTLPYPLPDNQTRSTLKSNSSKGGEGFNELRFEDKKGSEEVWYQAEKDMTGLIKNQRTVTVDKADDLLTLNEGNRTVTIKKGDDALKIETGSRTTDIKKDETLTVEGKRSVTVTGKETHTDKDDFTHTVSGNYSLTVDGDLTITAKSISIKSSGTTITLTASTGLTAKAGTAAEINAGTTLTAEGGTNTTVKAGMNLNTEAGMQASHKGSLGMTLDGGVNLTAKGTMVSVKGDAMLTAEGGAMGTFKGAITKLGG